MFCLGAQAEQGVSMSVCEYANEAAARAGRDASSAAFKSIANREIFVNRSTTLSVLQSPRTSGSEALVKRAVEAFAGL
jgi:hypothetical protein